MTTRETVYAVYVDHCDRTEFLGAASGNIKDIKAFFDDRKAYGLTIKPLKVRAIPEGYAAKKNELLARKVSIERELRKLNDELTLD